MDNEISELLKLIQVFDYFITYNKMQVLLLTFQHDTLGMMLM